MRHPPNTRKAYRGKQVRFVLWLVHHHPELVVPDFLDSLLRGRPPGSSSSTVTNPDVARELPEAVDIETMQPPIVFSQVTPKVICTYIKELYQDADGKTKDPPPSYSTASGHRSAIVDMFDDYGIARSTAFDRSLSAFYRALRRKNAIVAGSQAAEKTGKRPLGYALFCELCSLRLRLATTDEHLLAHTVSVLSFVLMSRVMSVVTLAYSHMRWTDDALAVAYWTAKTDQEGSRADMYRHVYAASKKKWWTCPVLALGLYWLVCPAPPGSKFVFAGEPGALYQRITKVDDALFSETCVSDVLKAHHITSPKMLGTHSPRKGATDYAVSEGVPRASIEARLDHKMSSSDAPYFGNTYDAKADRFCGRVLGGHENGPEFAMLPASFSVPSADIKEFERIMADCFPTLPPSALRIAHFALAAVVEHSNDLALLLRPGHALFFTPPFSPSTLARLRSWLVCSHTVTSKDSMRATGLRDVDILGTRLDRIENKLDMLAQAPSQQQHHQQQQGRLPLLPVIERQASGDDASSTDGDRGDASDGSDDGHEDDADIGGDAGGVAGNEGRGQDDDADCDHDRDDHCRDVSVAVVDQKHELPDFDVRKMWRLWCCGGGTWSHPLRSAVSGDLRTAAARKRLSELRSLFCALEGRMQELRPYVGELGSRAGPQIAFGDLSAAQADALLFSGRTSLGLAATTPTGKPRDVLRLKWRSVPTTIAADRQQQHKRPLPLLRRR
eukprot:m51a1_g12919 hypothetical protein (728) ;mRNA; r:642-2825